MASVLVIMRIISRDIWLKKRKSCDSYLECRTIEKAFLLNPCCIGLVILYFY